MPDEKEISACERRKAMIVFDENRKRFALQTKGSSYIFEVDGVDQWLDHLYWGKKVRSPERIPDMDDVRFVRDSRNSGASAVRNRRCDNLPLPYEFQELMTFQGMSGKEPGIKITFRDGTRDLRLLYDSHLIEGDTLRVVLRDPAYPVRVTLVYRVIEEHDVIERHTVIENCGDEAFFVESAMSACLYLPYREKPYRLTHFNGWREMEFAPTRENIDKGKTVLESRHGLSGPDAVPFFMIDTGDATEDFGDVFFGSLHWSSNWKMTFERDAFDNTNIVAGMHDFDFDYCLDPGGTLTTPVLSIGRADGGFTNATQTIHHYVTGYVMHPDEKERLLPVIFNGATAFRNNPDEETVYRVIEQAHAAGVELFIIEGGWTGTDPASPGCISHRKGFGDWTINTVRFPHGLKPIADKLHGYGMKLGLWIEPETAHIESRLMKEHPEWIIHYPNREPVVSQWNCTDINIGIDEACDYITDLVVRLIRENEIDYFKTDFNRFIPQMGTAGADLDHCKNGWVKYGQNVIRMYARIKEARPGFIFENSAGGGKRTDWGMLSIAGRMHRSDNQDSRDALYMFESMSYLFPPKLQGGACFISDGANNYGMNGRELPLRYMAHVGMLSSLSISVRLDLMSDEALSELKEYIALAKRIRPTTQLGDFYRLKSVYEHPYGAYEYLSKDGNEAVVFLLGKNMSFSRLPEKLCLKGLDPDASYRITGHSDYWGDKFIACKKPMIHTLWRDDVPGRDGTRDVKMTRTRDYGIFDGDILMNNGFRATVAGDLYSEILIVEKV